MPSRRSIVVVHAAVALHVFLAGWTLAAPPTLGERLARLEERLEEARVEGHVPGMSIAVVHRDEVIYAAGFGLADVELNRPATPGTIYAIGSTTKAFTAAVIGMLVDEGRMTWDDPVATYLPYYTPALDSDDADAVLTVRDALSHRSGFSRSDMLWSGAPITRDEVLRTVVAAEPWAPFRSGFHYNNVMYLAAGTAAGVAAGSDWDTLIRTRLFEPLNMTDASLSFAELEGEPRLARGYIWRDDRAVHEIDALRNIDAIAPAGSINATVLDMANWIRFQLGGGVFDGTRLLSEASHRETWTEQVEIAGEVGYGLGWIIQPWRGRQVIQHGGNIDGFSAQVGLLPDEQLGYVLLTNGTIAAIQNESIDLVFDALAGDWDADEAPTAADELAPYVGRYIANFAHFKDAIFAVTSDSGRLAVDVPGQKNYELRPPDEDGRWYFADTDAISVSFDRNADGVVTLMKMEQGGATFEIPREGFTIAGEGDPAAFEKYLGRYRFELANVDVEALVQNGRLALDVPGQMVFELHAPDADGKRAFRITDQIAARFNEDEAGAVTSITMFQAGQEFTLPRIVEMADAALPTLDEILALRRGAENAAAITAAGVIRATGSVRFAQAGLAGTFDWLLAAPARSRLDLDLGRFGHIHTASDEHIGMVESSFDDYHLLEGEQLENAAAGHPAQIFGDWRTAFDSVEVLRFADIEGVRTVALRLRRGTLPPMTAYVDPTTGDLLQIDSIEPNDAIGGIAVVSTFADYRDVGGARLPWKMTTRNEYSGRVEMIVEHYETGVEVDPAIWTIPDPRK